MDLTVITTIIETIGLPATMLIIGALLYRESQKQASKRDSDNAELHKQHIAVQAKQTEILERLRDTVSKNRGDSHEELEAIKEQLTDATNIITAKIDGVSTKIDTHYPTILGKFAPLMDSVTALQTMFNDAKTAHDHRLEKLQASITALKDDVQKTFNELREEKQNEKTPNVDSMLASSD